jgi:hypothetical protein
MPLMKTVWKCDMTSKEKIDTLLSLMEQLERAGILTPEDEQWAAQEWMRLMDACREENRASRDND